MSLKKRNRRMRKKKKKFTVTKLTHMTRLVKIKMMMIKLKNNRQSILNNFKNSKFMRKNLTSDMTNSINKTRTRRKRIQNRNKNNNLN